MKLIHCLSSASRSDHSLRTAVKLFGQCKARHNIRFHLLVVKMLSVMEQAGDPVQEFLTSGRTGRRNALPDILGEHAATTTADLSHCLQKLTTADLDGRHPSTSGVTCQGAVASTSTAANGSGTASDGASSGVSNMETDISQSGSNVHS
ncbi:uncharacterized protein LOC126236099 isoform X1 [Schistocerca nitens]|uniref:uncharacterized protein LOC126236099 isoform X1 n=1 Tax=Schistocerca nitens TaxID=7011 RepID=UPI002117A7D3|nr:uncharacterized protein LOC126236099 isoform X1 [Schistocerca nitens]